MTLVLLNDVNDSRAPQLFFVHIAKSGVATIVKTQMRDETKECLSLSVKKTNKDAKTLKHTLL